MMQGFRIVRFPLPSLSGRGKILYRRAIILRRRLRRIHPRCLPPSPSMALGLGLLIPTRILYVSFAYSPSVNDAMAKLTAEGILIQRCSTYTMGTLSRFVKARPPTSRVPSGGDAWGTRPNAYSAQNRRCTPSRWKGGKRVDLYMWRRDRGAAPCTHVRHAPANASERAFSILLPHPHIQFQLQYRSHTPSSLRTRTRRVLYSPRSLRPGPPPFPRTSWEKRLRW
ncbi:hypothetical protein LXA43DRAFT_563934 [Ganoderma leucocontextum]|nr:hypothetical protein LXA43DRAFT_563934 [Ganoderma leucocontextum]